MLDEKILKSLREQLVSLEKEHARIDREIKVSISERESLRELIDSTRAYLSGKTNIILETPAKSGSNGTRQLFSPPLIEMPRPKIRRVPLTKTGRNSPLGDNCLKVLSECKEPVDLKFVYGRLKEQGLTNGTETNVWLSLNRLKKKGLVVKPKSGQYVLASKS